MKQIKVSVILTVYNNEKYLTECLNSIINQSLKNIEIIIVNDGSIDSSLEIINNFCKKDSRIKIVNQINLGAATARNNGIKLAKGKYLSILDGDDIFDIDMLKSMYLQASKNKIDVLICPYRNLNEEKKIKRGMTLPKNIKNVKKFSSFDIKEEIFGISNPTAWNKLFKRKFILKNDIMFQDLTSRNDLYFSYFALSLAKKISILNESFVSYRKVSSFSISSRRGEKFLNIFHAMGKLKESLILNNSYETFTISFFRRAISNIMYESQHIKSREDLYYFVKNTSLFLEDLL